MDQENLREIKVNLDHKKECLQALFELTQLQYDVELADDKDLEQLEQFVIQKEGLIYQLNQLNSKFENLLREIKGWNLSLLYNNEDVQIIKRRNKEIMILSHEINQLEKKLNIKFNLYVAETQKKIKSFRVNNQIVTNYYKNISGYQLSESYFMDKRK